MNGPNVTKHNLKFGYSRERNQANKGIHTKAKNGSTPLLCHSIRIFETRLSP